MLQINFPKQMYIQLFVISQAQPLEDSRILLFLLYHPPLCIRHRERRDRAAFAF